MKRRSLLFILMLAFTSVCIAQQISEEQAYQTALLFLSGGQSAQKAQSRGEQAFKIAYKAQTKKQNDLYVFNREGGGFVIVSADARTIKPVLGYSDSGIFDADNMPPALQDILDQYQKEINYAREKLPPQEILLQEESTERRVIVEPLIKTKWNQVAPYNGLCPMDGDRRTNTGCVACAMAQVMNFWRWPERGYGSHRDVCADSLFVDFSQSVYDWNNMAISLTADTLQVKIDAVQKLIYDCGISVDMDYSINGTYSKLIAPSLMYFFNYSQSAQRLKRADYETQWDSIIAAELDAGRPVIYSGVGNIGGHSFICDGYDSENYFHYNLGWGGSRDGFYLTTAIRGKKGNGFNKNQDAVIGIYPDYEDQCREGMGVCRLDNKGTAVLYDIVGSMEMEELIIPDSALVGGKMYPVKSIGPEAFGENKISKCKKIITSEKLEKIDVAAFHTNKNLLSVYISSSVQTIGGCPFLHCKKLNTIIIDESNPKYYTPQSHDMIIERANGRLVQLCYGSDMPSEGIKIIGENIFDNLDSLIVFRLPESVEVIEDDAFANCSNLKEVYLGTAVKKLGVRVFRNCPSLTDLYFYSATAPAIGATDDNLGPCIPNSCTIHVKPSALESFKTLEVLSTYTIVADVPETAAAPSVRTEDAEPQYYDLLGRPVDRDYKGLKIRQHTKGSDPTAFIFEAK